MPVTLGIQSTSMLIGDNREAIERNMSVNLQTLFAVDNSPRRFRQALSHKRKLMFKKSTIKLIPFLCLILAGCSNDASYPLADGGSHSFKNDQGKLTLINYWAIWCSPCREEIPELNHFAEEYADQLTILAVNFDNEQGEKLQAQVEKLGIEFSSLQSDPRALWSLKPVSVLPETLIIDSEGVLLHRLIGPQTLESLSALIAE